MRRYAFTLVILLVLLTFIGCNNNAHDGVNGGFIRKTYSGTVEKIYEDDGTQYLEVKTADGETIVFTLTDETEIQSPDNISAGNKAEIDCVLRYKTSTHEALGITVTPD